MDVDPVCLHMTTMPAEELIADHLFYYSVHSLGDDTVVILSLLL